jgi:hypothetical protein
MHCHICKADATGQCKQCGKFYCPTHGDVYCVNCRSNQATADEAEDPIAMIARQAREESLGINSDDPDAPPRHRCYACGVSAVSTCDRCRNRFCQRHGCGRPTPFRTTTTLICSRCIGRERLVGLAIGFVLLLGFLAVLLTQVIHR